MKTLKDKRHIVKRDVSIPDYYAVSEEDLKQAIKDLKKELCDYSINEKHKFIEIAIDKIFGVWEE